ncbi:hypothetical protein ACGFYY_09820 [Streptomyces sp. NPDC048331]|uniref:hypothetical protein n=1 Tax=Streptomyces sp. NPDC048331 TaxID=3365534 RepID=UPI00371408F4
MRTHRPGRPEDLPDAGVLWARWAALAVATWFRIRTAYEPLWPKAPIADSETDRAAMTALVRWS